MQIGEYKLHSIETGTFWLDGGAMFGTIPKIMWQKAHQPDESNRIKLAMRALLIQGRNKNILVDCGLGDKGGEKFVTLFNVDQKEMNLESSLKKLGLTKNDITDVILTHLHFDHAGGAAEFKNGSWHPNFSNATYYLQRENLITAQNPNPRERASYLPEIYQPLVQQDKIKLLDGDMKLFPGIDLVVSYGHTKAQQLVRVSDEKTTLLYGGDIFPMRAHLPLPWIAGYDLQPLVMLDEKKKWLSDMVSQQGIIFYEHDPEVTSSKVKINSSGRFEAGRISLRSSYFFGPSRCSVSVENLRKFGQVEEVCYPKSVLTSELTTQLFVQPRKSV